jgi:hypothetical protein
VHVKIVTFDGDANGATTLQTKIQLWNRTGKGWPDVIFSEQVNDPVWMAKKPFEYAAADQGLCPDRALQQVAGAVDRAVHDRRHAVLRPGQPGPGRALGQQEAHGPVRLHGSDDVAGVGGARAEGRKGASRLHRREQSATRSATGSTCGQPVPAPAAQGDKVLINATDSHCTRMASLLDPLIKNGTVPPLSVFTPDFAKKYGGANDKVLMMPGPSWFATALFQHTLHIPAGR